MSWKCYLGSVALLVLGMAIGGSLAHSGKYADGRLSACKDMMNVIVGLNPLVAMAKPGCAMHNGDAVITLGGKLYTLDGQREVTQ